MAEIFGIYIDNEILDRDIYKSVFDEYGLCSKGEYFVTIRVHTGIWLLLLYFDWYLCVLLVASLDDFDY